MSTVDFRKQAELIVSQSNQTQEDQHQWQMEMTRRVLELEYKQRREIWYIHAVVFSVFVLPLLLSLFMPRGT